MQKQRQLSRRGIRNTLARQEVETIYTEQQKQLDLVDEEDADRDPKEGLVEQLLRQHRPRGYRYTPREIKTSVNTRDAGPEV